MLYNYCQFVVPYPITRTRFLTSLVPTTPAEVERHIRSAPAKTSPLDLLPTTVLKACDSEFSNIISHIANRSFAVDRLPSVWGTGLASPLLKKPGLPTSDLNNLRPITNLTTVSKIVERLTLARLKSHIPLSLISAPCSRPTVQPTPPRQRPAVGVPCSPLHRDSAQQSVHCAAHTTETALVKNVDDIIQFVDSGSIVALVGLDISAAFDTVNHATLLAGLQSELDVTDTPLS